MIRAARKPAAPRNPAFRLGDVFEIPLRDIVGVDPCNDRRLEPGAAAIAELGADIAARGLLYPLIVRGEVCYRVLAGGRRWRAMTSAFPGATLVAVRLFIGDDEDAAALSLRENIHREDLHPLDEADRVAEMALRAQPQAVARALGRTKAWVEGRVALSALPEVARAAWLAGTISLAQARELCLGDAESVAALFARPDAVAVLSAPKAIRAALLPEGVSSLSASARFVGLDAYVAAGGKVRADLFEEEAWLLDADLLRKLERRKLSLEADRLCEAEGWGTALFDAGDFARCVAPEYTAAEVDEIKRLERSDAPEDFARAADIQRLGVLRKIAGPDRANYGLYVGLDSEGRLDVVRGVRIERASVPPASDRTSTPSPIVDGEARLPTDSASPVDAAASVHPRAEAANPSRRSRETSPPVLHADARRMVDLAASRACAEMIGKGLVGDAMRIVLATWLAKSRVPLGLIRLQGPGGHAGPLARRIAGLPFPLALAELAEAEDSEVEEAFVEVVSGAVDRRRADDDSNRALLGFLDRLEDGAASAETARQIDYPNFFAVAGREVALTAIRDCGGPAAVSERAWMTDRQLVDEAALLAHAKEWLPQDVRVQA